MEDGKLRTVKKILCSSVFGYASTIAFLGAAYAENKTEFDVPAGDLKVALDAYIENSGKQLIYKVDDVRGVKTKGVDGRYAAGDALQAILDGTGYRVRADEETGASVITKESQVSERRLPNDNYLRLAQVETVSQFDVTAGSENMSEVDQVIVTGSRIRRSPLDAATPLQVFDAADLAEIGTFDLAEALEQIPGVDPGVSPQNGNNFIQSSGLSTISLRGLGDDRTLVLINGKRAVSNSGNSDRVSLSTLPEGFVTRTEITTGGGSAVYGSDAIAGVANFILEDSFEGFQIDGRWSAPQSSGGEEYKISGRVGIKVFDDRGYFLVGVTYRDEAAVLADASRPNSIRAIEFDDPSTFFGNDFANEINQPGCDPTNEDRHCFLPSLTAYSPGGVFEFGDAWFTDGRWFNDRSLNPGDREPGRDHFADFDGFNFRPGRTLLAERSIFNIAGRLEYDVTETTSLSLTTLYSDVDSVAGIGPQIIDDRFQFGLMNENRVGSIAPDHPFIPPEVEETRSGSVQFQRQLTELGPNERRNDRGTLRLIADVTGRAANFDWEVYGTYGRFSQKQVDPNEVNLQSFQHALNIEDDGAGGFQCIHPDARADGCVPINIFGEGTITPEAADYVRYNGFGSQVREQFSAGGYLSGPVFDTWAGAVKVVAGMEFRRESQSTDGDPDGDEIGGLDGDPTTDDVNQTTLNVFPDLSASFNVVEAFGEVDIPLIEDQLTLQTAVRWGHYSTIGSIVSYNAGLVWTPIEDLRFRAQFARSQRAPNLTELFSPPRQDADGLNDPCDGLLPDGTGINQPDSVGGENADLAVVSANCLSEPGIQAFFADPGNAGDPFEFNGGVQGPNSGNLNVQEETANTYTAGLALRPSFAPGLGLSADYYRISIKDAITSISTQATVDICYASTDFPNNKFCNVITRNAFDGRVTEVINFQENLDEEVVSGIDFSLFYDFEVPDVPGEFDLDFRYSHTFKDETTFTVVGGDQRTVTGLGEIGDFNDEFRAKLGYRYDDLRLTYTVTYRDGGVDDLVNDPNPEDDRFFRVESVDYHRVYAAYTFGQNDQFRLYGGVNNLFNDTGPFLPSGLDNGSSFNIINRLNAPLGREYYIGVRANF